MLVKVVSLALNDHVMLWCDIPNHREFNLVLRAELSLDSDFHIGIDHAIFKWFHDYRH